MLSKIHTNTPILEKHKENKTAEIKSKELTQAQKILIGLGIALGTAALGYAFFYRNHSIISSHNNRLQTNSAGEVGSELDVSKQSRFNQISSESSIDSISSDSLGVVNDVTNTLIEAENTKIQLTDYFQILLEQYHKQISQAIRLEKLLGNDNATIIQEHCNNPIYLEECQTQQDTNIVQEKQDQLQQTYKTGLDIIKIADSILLTIKNAKIDSEKFMNQQIGGIHYPGYGHYPSGEALFASYEKFAKILNNPNLSPQERSLAFHNALEDQKATSPVYHTLVSMKNAQCLKTQLADHGHGNIEMISQEPCSSSKSITIGSDCDSLPTNLRSKCQDALDSAQKYKTKSQDTLNALLNLRKHYYDKYDELLIRELTLGHKSGFVQIECEDEVTTRSFCSMPEGSEQEKNEAAKNIETLYEQDRNLALICGSLLTRAQLLVGSLVKQKQLWSPERINLFTPAYPAIQGINHIDEKKTKNCKYP